MSKIKFKEAAETELFCRRISEDGKIEIGVWRVAFGFRVRVGRVGSMSIDVDYCAGADHTFLEVLYSLVLGALESGVQLHEFPIQNVKPYYNDPENFKELIRLAGNDYERVFIVNEKSYLANASSY